MFQCQIGTGKVRVCIKFPFITPCFNAKLVRVKYMKKVDEANRAVMFQCQIGTGKVVIFGI